jgi:hypothetical protein
MPASATRPAENATAALALTEGDIADLTDALLEVRAARERLHRVDALLSRLLAEVQLRLPPKDARGRAVRPRPAPDTRVSIKDNSDAEYTNRAG